MFNYCNPHGGQFSCERIFLTAASSALNIDVQ